MLKKAYMQGVKAALAKYAMPQELSNSWNGPIKNFKWSDPLTVTYPQNPNYARPPNAHEMEKML